MTTQTAVAAAIAASAISVGGGVLGAVHKAAPAAARRGARAALRGAARPAPAAGPAALRGAPTPRAGGPAAAPAALRFEVSLPKTMGGVAVSGRLLVVMSAREQAHPRFSIGRTGLDAPPAIARDMALMAPGAAASIDRTAITFPIASLDALPAGEYSVQAALLVNPDLKAVDAPGNLSSRTIRVRLDPASKTPVRLALTERAGPETLPPDRPLVHYVKLPSPLLSRFWKRPMFLRAGIILPKDFVSEPRRRYPLWVRIGGFGSRYTAAGGLMREGSPFQKMWLADDTQRFVAVTLDGDGPYGDPYQVNSANNGPYGDAVTQELIPYVEQAYRCVGKPGARFLSGASTGGWVALALQVFYPDFFNGCWSASPDPVDFRAYELINIYVDTNAYVNKFGFERPASRTPYGETVYTMRHECQAENLRGPGNRYTASGGQWCAWNATFGRRGPDGRPIALWDPVTGAMMPGEAEYWKPYDIRAYLEAHWKEIGPRLRGKIHITVGEGDNYFLNNAVHLLDQFLRSAEPPYGGTIKYGPGQGHTWSDIDDRQMLIQMQERRAHAPDG